MNTKRFSSIALLVVLFAGVAFAQSTPYSAPRFSAPFNGPVKYETDQNDAKTSVNNEWSSSADGIFQQLTIREIAKGVDVNQATLDFYVNQALDKSTAIERTNGVYQGHIWGYASYNQDGEQWRMWFIVVDSNTVFVLSELTATGNNDSANWATFSKSLVIK